MTKKPEVQGTGAGFYAVVTTDREQTLRYSVPFSQKRDTALWVLCRKQNQNLWDIYVSKDLIGLSLHQWSERRLKPRFQWFTIIPNRRYNYGYGL